MIEIHARSYDRAMSTTTELKVANYLMAIEGLAMIRNVATGPSAVEPRANEIAMIVRSVDRPPLSTMIDIIRHDVGAGYSMWAPRYDGPNPAIEAEEPVFTELVRASAPGTALDAACGTGRHSAILSAMGWNVIGVDATDAMLERARAKVPDATFHQGRMQALPVDSDSVDLVVCGLALSHVKELAPVYAEFERVLKPGGRVITTDMHPTMCSTGGMAAFPVTDQRPDVAAGDPMTINYVPNLVHNVNEYVAAIVDARLEIVGCHEPLVGESTVASFPSFEAFPDATRAAFLGLPYLLIWDLAKRA
jgi:ubiquinone/menaquinone biosynthesis C-methylase UbiE